MSPMLASSGLLISLMLLAAVPVKGNVLEAKANKLSNATLESNSIPLEEDLKIVLFKEKDGHKMVEMIYVKSNGAEKMVDCFLVGDPIVAKDMLEQIPNETLIDVDKARIHQLIEQCSAHLLNQMLNGEMHTFTKNNAAFSTRGYLNSLFIFPGTKWCGAGNIADNFDDLGSAVETDSCCRTHDHCEDNIPAFGKKYELKNKAIFTKSHCSCDRGFQQCLRSANSIISNSVGSIFFNLLQAQCFEKNHPIKKCLRHSGWIPWIYWSCQQYEFNSNAEKIWQFFDAQYYS